MLFEASTPLVSSVACSTRPQSPVTISFSVSLVLAKKVRLYGGPEVNIRKLDTSSILQNTRNLIAWSLCFLDVMVLGVVLMEGALAYGTHVEHDVRPQMTCFVLVALT